ncbi:hypothetical protein T02_9709, partial [Trichinella nativa]
VISQSPNNAPTTNQQPANHKNVSNFRGWVQAKPTTMNNAWNLQRIRENCHRTKRVYEPIYMSTYDIPVACCLKKCLMSSVCIRLSHAAGRNGNSRKTSDSSTTKSTTQKGNLPVRDRRAATFIQSSAADRCPVCKASACPDVRKQIMVNGGSWRGRH